jgi:integrase
MRTNAAADALVFPTSSGSRRDKDNARERVIRPVVAHADALLADRGREPLPAGMTAHKLRHTFASILIVRGEDPPYVMAQLGTPTRRSRCASTPTRCAATRATRRP